MKKRELLEALKDVGDEEEIFVCGGNYDPEDDGTWGADAQTTINEVNVQDGEVNIVIDVDEFM